VSPFGKIFNLPVWVDRSLSKQETINFNAGMRTHSISMSYADYLKVEQPNLHVFTEEEIELGDLPVDDKKKTHQKTTVMPKKLKDLLLDKSRPRLERKRVRVMATLPRLQLRMPTTPLPISSVREN